MEVAEEGGSRTHQARLAPLTGFEDRAPHRGAILFHGIPIGYLDVWNAPRIARIRQLGPVSEKWRGLAMGRFSAFYPSISRSREIIPSSISNPFSAALWRALALARPGM